MAERDEWEKSLPVMRLTPKEFKGLLEYSASLPTGTTPGKRWRRLNGAHDRAFIRRGGKPRWIIGQYDPDGLSVSEVQAMEDAGKRPPQIRIFWYRPVICMRAATKEIAHG
jgi:hypothetical protein